MCWSILLNHKRIRVLGNYYIEPSSFLDYFGFKREAESSCFLEWYVLPTNEMQKLLAKVVLEGDANCFCFIWKEDGEWGWGPRGLWTDGVKSMAWGE